ncbi:hypothetical protein N9333_03920 [Gammaproteobacteria bacterium]|nr:hypothetical protein [Gammaproteobacteria bacterium]
MKISLEFSGKTLERILSLDKNFIRELKRLIDKKSIEIVGSGYVQLIGPLLPHQINSLNLQEGQNVYLNILGIRPKTALISEMALSHSLIDLYLDAGFETIIMDIDNIAESLNVSKNHLYKYGDIKSHHLKKNIKIVWSDSIMFQKFQRYVHGDLSINDYLLFIQRTLKKNINFYLPIYTNDAEVFNYRPGRFQEEAKIDDDEWKKITLLLQSLNSELNIAFKNPTNLSEIKNFLYKKKLTNLKTLKKISSASYPVPVKKQKKYNINRWAVTGRDDQFLNVMSYRIFHAMKKNLVPQNKKNIRFLLENSASDLRTHITLPRWDSHIKKLNNFIDKYKIYKKIRRINKKYYQELNSDITNPICSIKTIDKKYLEIQTQYSQLKLNIKKGLSIESLEFKDHKFQPYLKSFENDFFDSISFGADFFSGNVLLEVPSQMKRFTDLTCSKILYQLNANRINLLIEVPSTFFTLQKIITVDLSSQKVSLGYTFKNIKPFIGILRVGNFLFSDLAVKKKMKIKTMLGGEEFECFEFGDKSFDHTEAVSQFVSSSRGIPATSGVIEISDTKNTGLRFSFENESTFSMPMIKYQKMHPHSFLRLIFSLRELDDTSKPSKNIQPTFISITPIS